MGIVSRPRKAQATGVVTQCTSWGPIKHEMYTPLALRMKNKKTDRGRMDNVSGQTDTDIGARISIIYPFGHEGTN